MLFSFYAMLLSNFEASHLRRHCRQPRVQRLHHWTIHVVHYKNGVMDVSLLHAILLILLKLCDSGRGSH